MVKFPSNDTAIFGGRPYTFDRVFKATSTQEIVYTESAKPIVSDVLAGYNGTIFAYGQTASGKTHTMEGVIGDQMWQGIIPRIIQDIFNYIYTMDENLEFHIKVSYFEIYLDKIRDLLDVTKTNLAVHEDRNRVPYVKGASERFVSSPEEVLEVINEGKANRHVSVTNMNEHSSRSHSIFLINVKQENTETQKKLNGKLYLVDLAGSEKVSKTGAEGDVLEEAKNINKSLSALGNVISALAEGTSSYIPYRDSKMTRILQQSLGGNSRTTIIICASPSSFNEVETRSTLMFGQRAKTIKNTVVVNEELTADEWKKKFEKEKEKNGKLRAMLQHLEKELTRWRKGEDVPVSEQLDTHNKRQTELLEIIDAAPAQKSSGEAGGGGGGGSSVSAAERKLFEEERMKMYKQLDEKDDELQAQAGVVENIRQQMSDLEDQLAYSKANAESMESQMSSIAKEHDASKAEVKEVLQALEELAVNYDQKLQEVDQKSKDNEGILDDLNKETESRSRLGKDLELLQERMDLMTKKVTEITNTLLGELSEIGTVLGGSLKGMKRPEIVSSSQFDEEFTVARLYVSKLKTEVKTMVQLNKSLVLQCEDTQKRLDQLEKDFQSQKLTISQHEAKMQTLIENLQEIEAKKRILEEAVDTLNEEIAKQTSQEQMQAATFKEKEQDHVKGLMDVSSAKEELEKQMVHHREAHSKQVALLRDAIQSHEVQISELKEVIQRKELEEESIKVENGKLHAEITSLKEKYQALETMNAKKENAQKDLQGLEETVARELATLNKLRQMFVKDLTARMKTSTDENDTDETNSAAQKQKISFLENNLEQLTKVHKQLVRDNADLRLELPKLEKRLRATQERVKMLELALKDAKDGAMKDRSRYQKEVDRLKQAFHKQQSNRRAHQPQIAKIVRAGRHGGGAAIVGQGYSGDHSNEGRSGSHHPVVLRAPSPAKVPIVPAGSHSVPVIKGGGGLGDGNVSSRMKSLNADQAVPRNRYKRGDDPRRSSMYVESSHHQHQQMKGSASMDKLNMIANGASPVGRGNTSSGGSGGGGSGGGGREADIQALMGSGGRGHSRPGSAASSHSGSQQGDGWDRKGSSPGPQGGSYANRTSRT